MREGSNGSGRRWLRRVVAAASIVLLGSTFVTGLGDGRRRQAAEIDARLGTAAAERAAATQEYFDRARSLLLLLANEPSFASVYTAAGGRDAQLAEDGAALAQARRSITYLQHLYDGRINEICYIDRHGPENARVVRQTIAANGDLSKDESASPFFAPTFAISAGHVYQAAPYVSPDTHEWVISNSTPVPGTGSAAPAIVHFELTLESLRAIIGDSSGSVDTQVVDAPTGRVVLDTRYPETSGQLGQPADDSYLSLARSTADTGLITTKGRRAAYRRVAVDDGNANDWFVVASVAAPSGGTFSGIGRGTVSLLGAAALLAAVGAMSMRGHQRHLRRAALSDGLTGLPNRNMLMERAAAALADAERTGRQVAFLLLDLDRFKEINDTLGHQWGDELIKAVGPRITPTIRSTDLVARLGGDEFVVLITDVRDEKDVARVAERILTLLAEPFQLGGVSCGIEASIGIAIGPRDGADVHALMQHADVAMYVAKQNHVGTAVYDSTLDGHNPRKLSMLGELRRAIEEHELVLHFQPKTALQPGQPRGVEALVRWQHPERGLIAPAEFVPLAEHTAIIQSLTNYVLDAALAQCRVWRDLGHEIVVAVNISARSLHDATFYGVVTGALERHGVPAELLELEITETSIMEDPKGARELLVRLNQLGVQLAIDDFGTGYSSLAYLKTLPVNSLKIDKSFVMHLHEDQSDAVIVQSVIDLGRNLGMSVVAEGVERAEIIDYLTDAGCQVGQGFYWSQAVPADELTSWVAGLVEPASAPTPLALNAPA